MCLLSRRRIGILVLFLSYAVGVRAQDHEYTLGTNVTFSGGATNGFAGSAGQTQSQRYTYFYGMYPSISLKSAGPHTLLDTTYAYGLDHGGNVQNSNQQSHTGSLTFTTTLSPELKISITDAYHVTSDAFGFNAIQGIASNPVSPIVFYPIGSQIASRNNSFRMATNYRVSDRSSLSFTVSHLFQDYGGSYAAAPGALQKQQRFSGDLAYGYQTGKNEIWTLGYSAAYFNFTGFENAYTQTVHAGYSNQIGNGLTLDFGVGASEITSQGTAGSYVGFNSLVNLHKTFRNKDSLGLYYNQTSGDASGLGSISDTRRAGLSFNHSTRVVTMFADVSVFDTRGTLDNTYNTRAASAAASIGIPLGSEWSAQAGAQYQAYDHRSPFAFDQKRVYFTLHYTNPRLWKASK
jgi:hypothetical protein